MEQDTGKTDNGHFWRDIIETILLALVIYAGSRIFVRNFRIQGASMEPTFQSGQYILIARFSYWFHPPERGDIVVFSAPQTNDRDLVKRVVGLPGEKIEITGGQVIIDGHPLIEPYAYKPRYQGGPWNLQQDEVFVLGDNRNNSTDSHIWGPLNIEHIIGKSWFCFWPPSSWGEGQTGK